MAKLLRRLRSLSIGPRPRAPSTLKSGHDLFRSADWRASRVHPTEDGRPDLRCLDLRGAALGAVDLSGCRLDEVRFDGASLEGANLSGSDLRGATFVGCRLTAARLDAVNGLDSRFDDAALEGASLCASNFAFTSFRRARLEGAQLHSTTFFNADLRNASFVKTMRHGADFEDADTNGIVGGNASPTAWRDLAAPSFAGALRSYLSLMRLSGHSAEVGLRAVEAGIESTSALPQEVRGLLTSQVGWRVQLIGACAIVCGGLDAETAQTLWSAIEARSWVSPQLVVAAARADPRFVERAVPALANAHVPTKSRGALAAVLLAWFPAALLPEQRMKAMELGSTEREGFAIALRWAARFDALMEPVEVSL